MEVLSILFSGLAAIGSFISIFISVRQGYAQIISAQRFDWIENVRRTISDFLDVFFDESISVAMKKKILEKKRNQVELYVDTRENSGYNNIDHIRIKYAMINCIKYVDGSDDQKISCVADLVTCAQDACANAHRMAKLEAGGLQKHI